MYGHAEAGGGIKISSVFQDFVSGPNNSGRISLTGERKRKEKKKTARRGERQEKGPRKEKGAPRVNVCSRTRKQSNRGKDHFYIYPRCKRVYDQTRMESSCVRPRYFGESESCVARHFPVRSCVFVERETYRVREYFQ